MHPPHCFPIFSKAWIGPSLFPSSENPGELLFIESGLSLACGICNPSHVVLAYFSNLIFNYENCISGTLSFSPSGHTTLSHAITTLHMTNQTPRTDSSSLPQFLQVVTLVSVHLPTFITTPAVFSVCLSPPTDTTLLQCKARLYSLVNPRTSFNAWHVV